MSALQMVFWGGVVGLMAGVIFTMGWIACMVWLERTEGHTPEAPEEERAIVPYKLAIVPPVKPHAIRVATERMLDAAYDPTVLYTDSRQHKALRARFIRLRVMGDARKWNRGKLLSLYERTRKEKEG